MQREAYDLGGAGIFCLSLVAIIVGVMELPSAGGAVLSIIGLIGMGIFVLWEQRVPSPLLDIRLFQRSRVFVFSNLAALISYSATFAVSYLLSLYLQYIKGLPPQQAGLLLVTQPLTQAVFSPLAGRLSDRVEPRIVASAGMALTSVGLFVFVFLSSATSTNLLVGTLAFLGLGFALFSSPNTNAVMSAVERRQYGVASATLGTMRYVGQMLSLAIVTVVFALVLGRVPITPTYYPRLLQGVRIAFGIMAPLCVAGVWASLIRGRMHETALTSPVTSSNKS